MNEPDLTQIRVLVIDENPAQLQTLSAIIAGEGLDVVGCATGEEGLAHLQSGGISIVIAELRLPDMGECEFLESLAAFAGRVCIILNSENASIESVRRAVNFGAFACIEKAGDTAELLSQVRRAVDRQLRRQAEQALRESEERFNLFMEHSPIYVFFKDENLRALRLSKNYEEMLGMRLDELLGKSMDELFPSDLAKSMMADDFKILHEGVPLVVEEELNGRSYSTTKFPVKRDGVAFLAGFTVDITDRKQAEAERDKLEEQLRQSEKMQAIGQLAGGIAHDFNNQLSGILGYAELLVNRLDDERLSRCAANIVKAASRSADLTNQLLAFARKGDFKNIPTDIHKTIADVIALGQHSLDKRTRIRQHLEASPSITRGDPAQLQSALLNLVLNANDAMPTGGELTFSTDVVTLDEMACKQSFPNSAPGRYLKISLTDTGTGMDDETRRRAFEPFFTTKDIGKGAGMGLAGVYGAVERHKGMIAVESEVGVGSTFTVYLPQSEEEEVEDHSAPIAGDLAKGAARILVVDDEEILRDIVTDAFRELGYKVTTAEDGEAAVDYYEKSWEHIDLVLLDLSMPKMSGREVFVCMRQINPNIKAILYSGYDLTSDVREVLDEGAVDFLRKPFSLSEIAEKVASALQ